MITGLMLLAKSKSQDLKNRKNKENYSKLTAAEGGGNLATNTFYFIIGILILCLELVFMFFNINIVSDKKIIETVSEIFTEYLNVNKQRKTPERYAILKEDALGFPIHLDNFYIIASKYPSLRFVIDHLTKPKICNNDQKEFDHWKNGMSKFSNLDNVYCKFSGMVTEACKFIKKTK